ncbi:agmatine/peptidylarginine deiminase [Aquimonas sp.]|jgi:agmatine/peptidylarginine deiminase|uniref:agmatine deiminase family protein n=1 Tax=Aquimonas sp. TaxID=1872588 RepID=UPI0037BE39E5
MNAAVSRFPAEWELQSAVLIAWPHADTDWAARLQAVEATYVELAAAITRLQPLVVCVRDLELQQHVLQLLAARGVGLARVHCVLAEYDDTWLRDSGPITLRTAEGFELLDFRFTGWGGKFEASSDDRLVQHLVDAGVFAPNARRRRIDFALEGGGIETDGAGTLLSTWHCLSERHPERTREDITVLLCRELQQQRVLWLDHGYLEGDDTDAHIDTLARFASPSRIVYQGCSDPADSHFDELAKMGEEITALRQRNGEPYEVFVLPWAQPILDEGRRLAASYANFLIINGAVLMPAYGDAADAAAQAVLARAFPEHQIIALPCRPLIWQNGSLHCITMQLPNGVLNARA